MNPYHKLQKSVKLNLDKGSTVARYKNKQLEIIGLEVQASPEIILLCCVLY